ncbi:MAG: autoinducer synthase [Rhodospirillaceae bacterium]|nr:autoinducer synthase [Rhodospirillaceae bacterium]MBT3925634.1 autoinducer synthase [Rhodospirillaceae bacterium]MBT5779674.1 autoinducer synthase [Rhodospirillaceae bacterium]
MVDIVTWESAHLFGSALVSHHKLRYRLFVERQEWDVPYFHGMEYDQFDTPAAVYLLQRDKQGEVRGATRLIPTTRPYMIKDVWPDLVDSDDLPASPEIWEGTRFGVEAGLSAQERNRVAAELVLACLEFGLQNGIQQYLVLMPILIIRRIIGGAGCNYDLLGETKSIGNHRVGVASVEVSHAALAEARRRFGIHDPVLSVHHLKEEAA